MIPKRIQIQWTKGWRMPKNTTFCGGQSKFGTPFKVGGHYKRDVPSGVGGFKFVYLEALDGHQDETYTTIKTPHEAVEWFRWYAERVNLDCSELQDRDFLACSCSLDQPCHVDVLLEILAKTQEEGDGRDH